MSSVNSVNSVLSSAALIWAPFPERQSREKAVLLTFRIVFFVRHSPVPHDGGVRLVTPKAQRRRKARRRRSASEWGSLTS